MLSYFKYSTAIRIVRATVEKAHWIANAMFEMSLSGSDRVGSRQGVDQIGYFSVVT